MFDVFVQRNEKMIMSSTYVLEIFRCGRKIRSIMRWTYVGKLRYPMTGIRRKKLATVRHIVNRYH